MDVMQRIEELRILLDRLGKEKGFQDLEVIKISQNLDELINKYYQLTIKQSGKQIAS